MSTLEELEKYLVGDGGYLLNDDNNGKTVMLSGSWGSGKTHFWLEDIKPQLSKKNQKNIYISLYGRESISELKFEVLKEAYNLEVKDDIISKSASMLSTIAPSFGEKSLVDGFDKLNKKAKEKKAEEILKSGSIICLDDFERKSSKIDLNDLFGYISQLALDYKCKVVIILNSDVFEGEEANVFKTVKEKTVNKFFYFEPSIEELFRSIYGSDDKYKRLDEYKAEIVNAIKDTEELNARIYIQVLDNCLEWIRKGYDNKILKNLVFVNTNFILNHLILPAKENNDFSYPTMLEEFSSTINNTLQNLLKEMKGEEGIYKSLLLTLAKDDITDASPNNDDEILITRRQQELYIGEVKKNESKLKSILKYFFKLECYKCKDYEVINNFVKTGILFKKEDNQ